MDIMDSSRRTDRASEKAREALVDVVGHPLLSSEEDASVIEVSDWIDGYADPSAGDFVGVLRALDGEIAVGLEFSGVEVTTVAHDGDKFIYINRGKTFVEECDEEDLNNMIMNCLRDDGVRLLHRSDEELPGAVQEAMEGDG